MDSRPLYAKPALVSPLKLLGGISPRTFMREYWQKRPLLVRQAIAPDQFHVAAQDLFALAAREEVESRLIARAAGKRAKPGAGWTLSHGPFANEDLPGARKNGWTLLVQGVNLHLAQADNLLRQFSFIPDARLDDLMISYATDQGGVGPHFDSYDVFLIQTQGRRRWRVSAQRDLRLVEDAPLKTLSDFKPREEWLLEPGDMLYLPPHYAHDGVAEGECMTCSVGFRAPSHAEIAAEFLAELGEGLHADKSFARLYADPGQEAVSTPARLPEGLVKSATEQLNKITWSETQVERFLGRMLSEPKPSVFFDPPQRPLSESKFEQAALRRGLRLHARSIALYGKRDFHLNGEALAGTPSKVQRALLNTLADARCWDPADAKKVFADPALAELAYDWYADGWLELG